MHIKANARRRWFGACSLFAAIALLVAGETVLKGRFAPMTFLAYWLGCLGFAVLAICTALLEAHALRQQSREERRALLADTLREIQAEQARRLSKKAGRQNRVP